MTLEMLFEKSSDEVQKIVQVLDELEINDVRIIASDEETSKISDLIFLISDPYHKLHEALRDVEVLNKICCYVDIPEKVSVQHYYESREKINKYYIFKLKQFQGRKIKTTYVRMMHK